MIKASDREHSRPVAQPLVSGPSPTILILKRLQRCIAIVAVIAISIYLYRHRSELSDFADSADLRLVAASIGLLSLLHLCVVAGFHWAHQGIHVRRPFRQALAGYLLRLPARYIPGGLWHTAARYLDIQSRQVMAPRVFIDMFVIETSLVATTGFVVAGLSTVLFFRHGLATPIAMALLVLAALMLVGFCLYLRLKSVRIETAKILLAAAMLAVNWVGLGIAFAIYARSLSGSNFATCELGILSSAYELSASIGYAAIFSPQGWGVTELVFSNLGACSTGAAIGVAVLTGFRLVAFVADAFLYTLVMAIVVIWSRSQKESVPSEILMSSRSRTVMATRGYQYGFSLQHKEVFDIESRTLKATTALAVLRDVLGARIAQSTLLNVGASSGAMDAVFAECFQRVFGIDIDSHAIDHAKRTFVRENLTFQVGDALNIPFDDASVDVVVCSQIHEHVQDQDKLFEEIFRVLRPNGVCYFAATNRWVLIEPHYRMWFLSWLPRRLADAYLRFRGRGKQYYERMVGLAELRRLTSQFSVVDYTARMLDDPVPYSIDYMVRPGSMKQRVSSFIAKRLPWICPGYIWILRKDA